MDFNDVIRKRKMIRKYNSKQVSDEIIRKLIRNAHRAPSAGHTQVQGFIIVKDPAIKKKLRKVAGTTPNMSCIDVWKGLHLNVSPWIVNMW